MLFLHRTNSDDRRSGRNLPYRLFATTDPIQLSFDNKLEFFVYLHSHNMDPLSFILLIWLLVSAAVFLFVQNVLPTFLPPLVEPSPPNAAAASVIVSEDEESTNKPLLNQRNDQHQQQQPFAGLSSWTAASSPWTQEGKSGGGSGGEPCEWVNDLLVWLHQQMLHSPVLSNGWLRAMNDASAKLAATLGCEVYFEKVTPQHAAAAGMQRDDDRGGGGPRLSEIRSEFGPREHMTIRATLNYPRLDVTLVASQKVHDRLVVSNYVAGMNNLNGQAHVRVACIGDDLFLMGCFEGKPEVEISLRQYGDHQPSAADQVDRKLVEAVIRRCLASAVTNISLARLKEEPFSKRQPSAENGTSTSGMGLSLADVKQCQAVTLQDRHRSNRLLLKVDKGTNLGGDHGRPYVVVEMDDPMQKHITTIAGGGGGGSVNSSSGAADNNNNPIWREQFLFDLNERSEEILFEVYDHAPVVIGGEGAAELLQPPTFLGLAIVGIEELRQSDSNVHTLTLQARPYTADSVTGTLTAEFIFLREPQFSDASRGSSSSAKKKTTFALNNFTSKPMVGGPLRVVTDFEPDHGGLDTAMHSPYIDEPKDPDQSKPTRDYYHHQRSNQQQLQKQPAVMVASKIRDQTPLTSDSELSVTSADSLFAQSQLIVEKTSGEQGGGKKYYFLPVSIQRHTIGKRLMKSGKKLHVYNEHTFSAVKMKSGSTCRVCGTNLVSAFSKKGYQCRDCGLLCHKRCHFKTTDRCPFSKVSTLPIEVVKIS